MSDELALSTIYQLHVDETGLIIQAGYSNVLAEGAIEVDESAYARAVAMIRRARLVGSELSELPEEDLPTPPAAPVITYPADLWRRCTEAEAGTIMDQVAKMPVRQQMIFNRATVYDHSDPDFVQLLGLMTQAFGAERAAELLAPST